MFLLHRTLNEAVSAWCDVITDISRHDVINQHPLT